MESMLNKPLVELRNKINEQHERVANEILNIIANNSFSITDTLTVFDYVIGSIINHPLTHEDVASSFYSIR